MKYKLKFEILNHSKLEKRNVKIDQLLSNNISEIESDYPISFPPTGSIFTLNKVDFLVSNIKYEIYSENGNQYYSILLLLNDKEILDKENYDKMIKETSRYQAVEKQKQAIYTQILKEKFNNGI